MNIREFLRTERHRLGLGHIDFVDRKHLDRKCLRRYIRHLDHLDVHINTVIEAGSSTLPFMRAYRFFPRSNYMYYNLVQNQSVFNFHAMDNKKNTNGVGPEQGATQGSGRLHDKCIEYGFYGPTLIIINSGSMQDLDDLASHSLPASCCFIFIVFDENGLTTCLEQYRHFDGLARENGFVLFECLETDAEHDGYGLLNVFIYTRKGHRILERYAHRGPEQKPVTVRNDAGLKQKNCLILGTGRSGTSMAGGIMYAAGYYMGENLYRGRETNPKGFYECASINFINEGILKKIRSEKKYGDRDNRILHEKGQGWLSVIPLEEDMDMDVPVLFGKIREFVKREPFCYKDPRFCYTLPVWLRFLKDNTVFVCIFREPEKTVNSILMECRRMPYLRGLEINAEIAFSVYATMYGHVLKNAARVGERMVFVHYNQLLTGPGVKTLSSRLGVELSGDFIDSKLDRTRPGGACPGHVLEIYGELCARAEYS